MIGCGWATPVKLVLLTAKAIHLSGYCHAIMRDCAKRFINLAMRCRLGHTANHFNVGAFRRKLAEPGHDQDASFFDHRNPVCIRNEICM